MAIDITKYQQEEKKEQASKPTGFWDFLNKDISFGRKGLNDKKKEAFYHDLAILLAAGVDIKTCMELIATEQKKDKDKKLFETIKEKIIGGVTLSDAVKATGMFSPYEYFSLQIGEESGKINTVLKELAAYYQSKIRQRRQIVGALTYPSIVLFTSFAAVFFMMNYIVPMFADVFKRFGGDLPAITAFIVRSSDWLSDNFFTIFLVIVGVVLGINSQKKKVWFRKYSGSLVLRLPFVGEMIRKIYLARFCQSMNLLISSRIPLLRAIALVKQMIGFYPLEVALTQIEDDILQGKSLHKSLSAFSVFPQKMVSLVKVGEEVNQLDVFFDKVGKQFTDDIEHQTSLISSMIEPFMIIFLGLIVGVILIAMYLPLFQLSTTF